MSEEDYQVQQVLDKAGIGSSPVDPSSLEALKALVRQAPPAAAAPKKVALNQLSEFLQQEPPYQQESNYQATEKRNLLATPNNSNERILEILEFQTTLLLETQQKLDVLTAQVAQLKRQREHDVPTPSHSYVESTQTRYYRESEATGQSQDKVDQPQAPPPAQPPAQHARQPESVSARIIEILCLFRDRRHGVVRPLDGGLIFKLLFFWMIASSRLSNRKNRKAMTIVLMAVAGLAVLIHLRYVAHLYDFVFKHRIPQRVWAGESVEGQDHEIAEPEPGHPPHPPAADNPPPAAWRNTFVAGVIEPPAQDQNPIWRFLQDILYLVGSFVLSIVPMWHAEQRQAPPEAEEEEANGEELNDQPEENHADGLAPIPRVEAPRDAMEPAEEDENDDNDQAKPATTEL